MNKMDQAKHDINVKRGLVDPEPEAPAEEPVVEVAEEPEPDGDEE